MRAKYYIVSLLLVGVSLLASLFLYNTVLASGENWLWTGNDEVDVTGGIFGTNKLKFTPKDNNKSTDPATYKTTVTSDVVYQTEACVKSNDRGSSTADALNDDGHCKKAAAAGLLQKCSNDKSSPDCKDVVIIECVAREGTEIELDVYRADNRVDIKTKGKPRIKGSNATIYKTTGVGAPMFCSLPAHDGKINNKRGGNAAADSTKQGLEAERDRMRDEYIKQQCGPTPAPDCAANAGKAFDTIYDACMRNTQSMVVTDQASAQAKVDAIKQCLKPITNLDLDSDKIMEGVLTIPDYVSEKPSCTLEWIGWIVCPATRFMGKLADNAFDALEKLLVIKPLTRGTKGGDSLFIAWALMRNIANVMFVIAFMVIIYSQVTGFGLDNYGIKKLLPRIIIAALLVNASYYIAVIMVDLSNIGGHSLYHILRGYADSLHPQITFQQDGWNKVIESIIGIGTAGVVATGVLLYASLSALVPLLTTVVISLLTAIMILVGRYAFIIILIIVAPIAFVAYLLPNTQKWYNLWFKTFLGLLLLYPIMGLIYGGSYLAGLIVMNSAAGHTGIRSDLIQIFGMSLTAIPLLLTPIIMKFSGGILNRFGGRVRNNGLFKQAHSKAEGFAERKKNQRDLRAVQRFGDNKRSGIGGLRDKAIQRRFKRDAIRSQRSNQLGKATSTHISEYLGGEAGSGGDSISLLERAKAGYKNRGMADDDPGRYDPQNKGEKYAASLAKGGDAGAINRALSQAVNARLKVHNEQVASAKEMLTNNIAESQWMQIAKGLDGEHNSLAMRQAAIEKIGELQDNQIDEVVKEAGSMDGQLRYALARSIQKNNNTVLYKNPTTIKTIMDGGTYDANGNREALSADTFHKQIVAPSINEGRLTQADLAGSEHETVADIRTAIEQGYVSNEAANKVSTQAQQALGNRYASEKATERTREQLQALSGQRPGQQPPDGH